MDFVAHLQPEVVDLICGFLSLEDLARLRTVSKGYLQVLRDLGHVVTVKTSSYREDVAWIRRTRPRIASLVVVRDLPFNPDKYTTTVTLTRVMDGLYANHIPMGRIQRIRFIAPEDQYSNSGIRFSRTEMTKWDAFMSELNEAVGRFVAYGVHADFVTSGWSNDVEVKSAIKHVRTIRIKMNRMNRKR